VIIFTSTRARNGLRTVSVEAGEKSGSLRRRSSRPSRRRLRRSRSVRSSCTGLVPPGRAGQPVASRASTLRARNGTRVGERGHMRASAVAWSVIFTNTKTRRSPNHVSWGSGFRGNSVGTDLRPVKRDSGRRIPQGTWRLVRLPRGRLRRPRARHRWRAVSRRNHLYPYKGAERARTVSVTAGEKLGSFEGTGQDPFCDFRRCFRDRLRLMLYTVPPHI
jgi:hypothetical protein